MRSPESAENYVNMARNTVEALACAGSELEISTDLGSERDVSLGQA